MSPARPFPGPALGLLTDLYQLTMAFGYFKTGAARQEACFALTFRRSPFGGGFALACGLEPALDYLASLRFELADLDYLATLRGNDDEPLFDDHFLEYLRRFELRCDVHAVPEGTVVFPHEPLLRVTGPLIEAQLVETALLTLVGFQTLVATKAARICAAARGEPVLEFGLRRAQGIDGGLAASRAAHVGGCAATSNVLAGRRFGIPVRGTHAHSWVMAFGDELEAFTAYAAAMPANCVFLVDTYDTLAGVRHACEVGRALRERGHRLAGIRLDSGDLAPLSIEARRILDEAGFPDAVIVASDDLDEDRIAALKDRGAAIGMWGVGTRLVTGHPQAALGCVYKLTAIRAPGGNWEPRVKLSEQVAKSSLPGLLQVRRMRDAHGAVADVIYDELVPLGAEVTAIDLDESRGRFRVGPGHAGHDLLVPVVRGGERVYTPPSLDAVRDHARAELEQFGALVSGRGDPEPYRVGLEVSLHKLRAHLVATAGGAARASPTVTEEPSCE
jgi:nicotinate phosphoribosyltransferase